MSCRKLGMEVVLGCDSKESKSLMQEDKKSPCSVYNAAELKCRVPAIGKDCKAQG